MDWLTAWGSDVRQGARALRTNPFLGLVAVASLALAIGANTAIFTAWSAVMQHRIAVRQPERLVSIYTQAPSIPGLGYIGVSHLDALDYARNPQTFSGTYEIRQAPVAMVYGGRAEQATAGVVSGNFFDVLGVAPAMGRVFHAADTPADGTGALAVLNYRYFVSRFGGNPAVLGARISINGSGFTVIGVAPPDFNGTETLAAADFWAPVTMHAALLPSAIDRYYNARNAQYFNMVGRLRPGVSLDQAAAAVRVTAARLAQQYPEADQPLTATVLPLLSSGINPNQRSTYDLAFTVMLAVVGMVLLIACANVANLLLARAWTRRREMAVRRALGASRWRLARQLLAESLCLGGLAGAAGLAVAWVGQRELWSHRPLALQQAPIHLSWNLAMVAFTVGLALLASLLFGLAPVMMSARLDLAAHFKSSNTGSAAGGGGRRAGLRGALLAGEAGFSIVALILAGLFLASLRHLRTTAPGFDASHLVTLRFDMSNTGFNLARPGAPEELLTFDRELLDRVRRLPGVAAATLASGTPMAARSISHTYQLEGQSLRTQALRLAEVEAIAPASFFQTMGIPLLEGRDFSPNDSIHAPKVMIVNQTFAQRSWPGQDPIGKRVLFHDDDGPTEVIGVARDSKYESMAEDAVAFAYIPLAQNPATALGLAVRGAGQGTPAAAQQAELLREMTQAVQSLEPQLAVTAAQPATVAIEQSLWAERMGAGLLQLLAEFAMLLAAIGVYGVAAYSVRQRWRELGIRMALGASAGRVFTLVLRDGLAPVLIGLTAGAGAAMLLAHAAASLLFGVGAADPAILLGYGGLFLAVAALACALPARRAARIDPLEALRSE
ncbi:MAG TPA: ABC transporter permease [Terriglobales bacterium]|nr:ABC transporter permease [Terriglobales bacterium]